jgi:hypothetical protein
VPLSAFGRAAVDEKAGQGLPISLVPAEWQEARHPLSRKMTVAVEYRSTGTKEFSIQSETGSRLLMEKGQPSVDTTHIERFMHGDGKPPVHIQVPGLPRSSRRTLCGKRVF